MTQPIKVIWPEHPFRKAKQAKAVTIEEYAKELGLNKTSARGKLEELLEAGTVVKTFKKGNGPRARLAVYTWKEASNGKETEGRNRQQERRY